MERFVTQRNLDLYRLLASKATTADQRKKLLSSLAQDQADMKRELRDWLKRNQK
jgi:F0F1-type ATP synthase delta subunit